MRARRAASLVVLNVPPSTLHLTIGSQSTSFRPSSAYMYSSEFLISRLQAARSSIEWQLMALSIRSLSLDHCPYALLDAMAAFALGLVIHVRESV